MYRLITVTMLWAASGEAFQLQPETASRRIHSTTLLMGSSEDKSENPKEEPIVEATVKIDDGGSNLTDRFKYKVNALMGVFDPQDGVDDERQDGNILNAMLKFPVRYTFNIVGKTSGDDAVRDEYVEEVFKVIRGIAGDDEMTSQITPRGKNFTKVQCEVEVQSSSMINSIYEDLEKVDRTVMRF